MHARAALVAAVRARWSWESVAAGVIAAAKGDLEELARPVGAAGLGARRLG
jgi:hypothetical protein